MLNIVTALKIEAEPIIKHFSLKNTNGTYKNEKINLIITGQGKLKSAINTTLLLTEYPYPTVNFGIAGSDRYDIGEGFFINKITDTDSQFSYYPDFFQEPSEHIYTVSKIEKYYPLVDMESSGFFESCYKFLNVNDIILYKIVSDTPTAKPDINKIPQHIKKHIPVLEYLSEELYKTTDFYEEINLFIFEAEKKMKLSKTLQNRLRQALILYKLKNIPFPSIHEIKEKEEVKKFITSLFSSLEI